MTESVSESSATILSNSTMKKSTKILHVDDDPSFLKVTKQCLETQGEFEVDTASSVDEALEKLKKTDYDIVVSDYQMPGKDGLELLKELREKGNTVPFIVFTGKGREEVAIKALNLGADKYIDKHGDPETVHCELAHGIRAILRSKRAEDAKRRTEERYRILLESISNSVYVLDREWRHVTVNQAGASFTHIPVDRLLGNKLTDLFPGVEKTPFFAAFRRVMETRKPETVDSKYVFEDGREGWYEVHVYPVPEGILCISSDITERKKMEEEIESLARFPSENPNSVLRVSREGVVLYANNPGKALLQDWEHKVADSAPEFLRNVVAETISKQAEKSFNLKLGKQVYSVTVTPVMGSNYANIYGMDITERKKAEEQLEESENKYRELFETSIDGIATTDMNGHFTDCNQACLKILGYTLEEMKKLTYKQLTPEKWRPMEEEIIREQIRKKGFTVLYEKELIRKDGSVFPVSNRAWVTFSGDGKPKGMWGIWRDITEHKKTEERLLYQANLLQNVSDAIIATDLDFRIKAWNEAAERIYGWKEDEVIGLYVGDVTHGEYLTGNHEEAVKQLLRDGLWEGEVVHKDKNGESLFVQASVRLIKDSSGNPTGAVAVNRDITEHREAEEKLKLSEQEFRGFVEDSAAAIATIDLKGRLTYVNKALADLFGYSVQEISGRAFKNFLHPGDRGRLVRLFLKIIVLRRQPRKFEFRALRKNGTILHLMCRPTRLERAGKTVGFQAVIMDNTTEKRMLERAEKISEKLSVVGGLTRHDVNNKLSVILSTSYLLRQRLRDNQSLELVKETESAVHQIERLFEFARTYEKLGTEELTWVDAEKVFNEAAMFFPSLQDIKIVNDCHGLTVFADSLLRQLCYNLIDNSLKHGEKPSRIRVFYEEKNDHLNVIYEDDGVGIPQAAKPKLFDEGYTTEKGSDHGLYLVKKMIEVYGWTIQETGMPGKGAKFTIIIPRTNQNGKENYRLH